LFYSRISRTEAQVRGKEKLRHAYKKLLDATGQAVAQAKRAAE
jgi:hypothetical protein